MKRLTVPFTRGNKSSTRKYHRALSVLAIGSLMNNDPHTFYIPLNRRRFFKAFALASAGFTLPGYVAEALTLSPTVTQGLTIRSRTTSRSTRTTTSFSSASTRRSRAAS